MSETTHPADPRIVYLGRFDFSDSGTPRFDWPGTCIQVRLQGTGCRFLLEEGPAPNAFLAIIDGVAGKTHTTLPGQVSDIAVDGLDGGPHTIALFKRSESENHAVGFKALLLDKGACLLDPPSLPERRIEFIGDSHTAALAVEATDWSKISVLSHNAYRSYACITARHFSADIHLCAASGKGLVHNHSDPLSRSLLPIPVLYERTLVSSNQSPWDFSRWIPRIVVLNIGTNDFAERFEMLADPRKTIAEERFFIERYHSLLDQLRSRYPGVAIVLMGPFDPCGGKEFAQNSINAIFEEELRWQAHDVFFVSYPPCKESDFVCCHPAPAYHERIAASLVKCINEEKLWERLKQRLG
jgi:hypothetical protein